MTEVEMVLELIAHNREAEETANRNKNNHLMDIQDRGGTITDAAAFDTGIEKMGEGADMSEVLDSMGFGDLAGIFSSSNNDEEPPITNISDLEEKVNALLT